MSNTLKLKKRHPNHRLGNIFTSVMEKMMSSTQKPFSLSASSLGTELVTIEVGEAITATGRVSEDVGQALQPTQRFVVHKKLLCDRSSFFRAAFHGNFPEATNNLMTMPEDDPTIFEEFLNWLYRDQLVAFDDSQWKKGILPTGYKQYCGRLFELYAFAEKLCINPLCNRIIDTLQDYDAKFNTTSFLGAIENIYNTTHDGSPLRKYLNLMYLYYTSFLPPSMPELNDFSKSILLFGRTNPDFAADVLECQTRWGYRCQPVVRKKSAGEMTEANRPKDPRVRDGVKGFGECFFHVHGEGEECDVVAVPRI